MKFRFLILLLLFSKVYAANVFVFVSFSMPRLLLEQTLQESVQLNIPVFLNGFVDNSMDKTIVKIAELLKVIPNLNLQIDPTLFEKFSIKEVPAIVVENKKVFDVIYGNLTIKEALHRIEAQGESQFLVGNF